MNKQQSIQEEQVDQPSEAISNFYRDFEDSLSLKEKQILFDALVIIEKYTIQNIDNALTIEFDAVNEFDSVQLTK